MITITCNPFEAILYSVIGFGIALLIATVTISWALGRAIDRIASRTEEEAEGGEG